MLVASGIGFVLCGVAIFGSFAAQLCDEIAHGVLGGAWKEKRRRRMMNDVRDHIVVVRKHRVGAAGGVGALEVLLEPWKAVV